MKQFLDKAPKKPTKNPKEAIFTAHSMVNTIVKPVFI